jgi:hypothetical protein
VQFDFRSHLVRFLSDPPFEYKPGTFSSPDGGIRVVSRMSGNIQSVFGTMLTLPVVEDVMLNGSKAPALLNTGAVMPVTAPPNLAKKSGSSPATTRVTLGNYEMSEVPVRVSDVKDEYDKSYTAIMGLGLLQNFTTTLDWKNKWIVLER